MKNLRGRLSKLAQRTAWSFDVRFWYALAAWVVRFMAQLFLFKVRELLRIKVMRSGCILLAGKTIEVIVHMV